MKIVIALDSFKDSLTAEAACRAVAAGLCDVDSDIATVCKPMADGGEGTAAALLAARSDGEWIPVRAQGPLPSQHVEAGFAWFPADHTALVEMAAASGLPLLTENERNPLRTNSYGLGELIRAAVERGARRILLAIGGSATVDGGTGSAAALGWRFLDANGRELAPGGETLDKIARIVPPEQTSLPQVIVLCDVTNPLCGPRGAAAVFGPQKGATPEMVAQLDAGLHNLAVRIRTDLGKDVLNLPGGGAAGGMGAGAVAFFKAELTPGITAVIEVVGLREALRGADWCVTGEGSFDLQSFDGKVVSGVAEAARTDGVPVVVFAGRAEIDREVFAPHGIREVRTLQPPNISREASMQRAAELLRETARTWGLDRL